MSRRALEQQPGEGYSAALLLQALHVLVSRVCKICDCCIEVSDGQASGNGSLHTRYPFPCLHNGCRALVSLAYMTLARCQATACPLPFVRGFILCNVNLLVSVSPRRCRVYDHTFAAELEHSTAKPLMAKFNG
jgi:hypothetical protein